jgi:hypothetical protein
MAVMDEVEEETPKTYAPGFEPPTDVKVPWYAWLLWPMALVTLLLLASAFFRGCMSGLS